MNVNPRSQLSPFFFSSVPKSGTHLLMQILNGIPGIYHEMDKWDHKFFLDHFFWKQDQNTYSNHVQKLKLMKLGQYAVGHIHYNRTYADMLDNLGFKHIFLYRDPRDVLVSLSYYVARHWKNHPMHNQFNQTIISAKDRMRLLLTGVPGTMPSFNINMAPYYGWLDDSRCLKIRFEDLTASASSRRTEITKIIHFLCEGEVRSLSLPLEESIKRAVKNIDPKQSHTFRKGIIGQWKLEADDELKHLLKKHIGKLLIRTGYEKNLQW